MRLNTIQKIYYCLSLGRRTMHQNQNGYLLYWSDSKDRSTQDTKPILWLNIIHFVCVSIKGCMKGYRTWKLTK